MYKTLHIAVMEAPYTTPIISKNSINVMNELPSLHYTTVHTFLTGISGW